jgi:hypothetical protein
MSTLEASLKLGFVLIVVLLSMMMVAGPHAPPAQTVPALDLGLD